MVNNVDIIDGCELVETFESYAVSSVKEVFGINLMEFMSLPVWVGDRLIELSNKIQERKQKAQQSILGNINDELKGITD